MTIHQQDVVLPSIHQNERNQVDNISLIACDQFQISIFLPIQSTIQRAVIVDVERTPKKDLGAAQRKTVLAKKINCCQS